MTTNYITVNNTNLACGANAGEWEIVVYAPDESIDWVEFLYGTQDEALAKAEQVYSRYNRALCSCEVVALQTESCDDDVIANSLEAERDAAIQQAEELDMAFEEWMLSKYGPAWQVDTWAEVGADQEAYNEEIRREFDEFMRLYSNGELYATPDSSDEPVVMQEVYGTDDPDDSVYIVEFDGDDLYGHVDTEFVGKEPEVREYVESLRKRGYSNVTYKFLF